MCWQERAKPNVAENAAWEIIYDKSTRKPLYYNQVTKVTVTNRPRCLDSKAGGRVSIKQPVVQVLYKNMWNKGILLGPENNESFLVKLDDKTPKVGVLTVHRSRIREWSTQQNLTPTSTKFKLLNRTVSSEDIAGQNQKKLSIPESDDETDSLSKLSDQFPRSLECFSRPEEEKMDEESSLVNPVLVVDDAWSDGRGLLTMSPFRWSITDEDVESDEPLNMTPIQTFPKAQSKRRKERMNAVLLDWIDFKQVCQEDEIKLLGAPDRNNADADSESRRPSIRMETSV